MEKNNFSYVDVLNDFGEDKVTARYCSLVQALDAFIVAEDLTDSVAINEGVMNQTIIDYFTDIYRLKKFHNIEFVNYNKIHAYMGYWINRRKPIQIIKDNPDNTELAFCNENFVSSYLSGYLHESLGLKIPCHTEKVFHFFSMLNYSLRYRPITPQTLELMLEGFFAGHCISPSL